MRLALKTAVAKQEYDFYLWLNDDTVIDNHALNELIECSKEGFLKEVKEVIICGACRISDDEIEFSYGGRTDVDVNVGTTTQKQATSQSRRAAWGADLDTRSR